LRPAFAYRVFKSQGSSRSGSNTLEIITAPRSNSREPVNRRLALLALRHWRGPALPAKRATEAGSASAPRALRPRGL